MITFKELQTLVDIFSKPAPDNRILNDIEDTLECAVIECRTDFHYVSPKCDKETANFVIRELEKRGYDCSHYSYNDGNLLIEFRWGKDEVKKEHNKKIYFPIPWEATFLADALAIAVDCMKSTERLYYVKWNGKFYYSDEVKIDGNSVICEGKND